MRSLAEGTFGSGQPSTRRTILTTSVVCSSDIARVAASRINDLGCQRGIFWMSAYLPQCRNRHCGNDPSYSAAIVSEGYANRRLHRGTHRRASNRPQEHGIPRMRCHVAAAPPSRSPRCCSGPHHHVVPARAPPGAGGPPAVAAATRWGCRPAAASTRDDSVGDAGGDAVHATHGD